MNEELIKAVDRQLVFIKEQMYLGNINQAITSCELLTTYLKVKSNRENNKEDENGNV